MSKSIAKTVFQNLLYDRKLINWENVWSKHTLKKMSRGIAVASGS